MDEELRQYLQAMEARIPTVENRLAEIEKRLLMNPAHRLVQRRPDPTLRAAAPHAVSNP